MNENFNPINAPESRKIYWVMLGIGVVLLILIAILLVILSTRQDTLENINTIGKKYSAVSNKNQLQWNNITLIDSTIYDEENNRCTASRYGMEITIDNCKAQDLDGKDITQDITFKWSGNQARNISWIFVYDDELNDGKIEVLENKSRTIKEYVNTWVNNYLIDNVVSYVNLTEIPLSCDLGNLNNSQYYSVTRDSGNGTYTQTICFTSRTIVNATAFRISGNADLLQDRTIYFEDYTDRTNRIINSRGLLSDNRVYYTTNSHRFNIGDIEKTRWTYTAKDRVRRGKFHILGYDTEIGLINSIQNEQYIYIDPWWSASWNYKKAIRINATGIPNKNNVSILINISFSSNMRGDSNSFGDLRFTNEAEDTELGYWFYNNSFVSNNSVQVWVFLDLLNTSSNKTIYMYYGNPSATTTSNIQTAFMIGDDFNGTSIHPNWNGNLVNFVQGGGVINQTSTGAFKYLQWKSESYNDTIIESRMSSTNVDSGGIVNVMIDFSQTNSTPARQLAVALHQDDFLAGISGDSQSGDPANNVWYRGYIENNNSGTAKAYWLYDNLEAGITNKTANPPWRNGYIMLESYTATGRWDWIYARRYLENQPTYAFGDEVGLSGLSIVLNLPSANQKFNISNIGFNFSIVPIVLNVTNWTLYIWNSSSYLVNKTEQIFQVSKCNQNYINNTNCGQTRGGSYDFVFLNSSATDNNWNSYSLIGALDHFTYYLPFGITNASWVVKDGNGIHDIGVYGCIEGGERIEIGVARNGNDILYLCNNDAVSLKTSANTDKFYEEDMNWTLPSSYNNTIYIQLNRTLPDASYIYGVMACANDSSSSVTCATSSNRTFSIDTLKPNITLLYPRVNSGIGFTNVNTTINFSASDTNLEACGYIYQGVTTAMTCSINASFIFGTNRSITLFTNDTYNNYYYINYDNLFTIVMLNQSYSSVVLESSTNNFNLNVTYNSTLYTGASVYLNYNNTNYSASKLNTGDNVLFSRSIVAPSITTNTIIPFYWYITLTNSTSSVMYSTYLTNQTINNFNFGLCNGSNVIPIMNLSQYDEITQSRLISPAYNNTYAVDMRIGDSSLSSYSRLSVNGTGNSFAICSNTSLVNNLRMDYTILYSSNDHVSEYINYQNYTLNSTTNGINISLYPLTTTDSQEFLIKLKDSNFLPIQNSVIEIYRYYVESGTNTLVESPLSDSLGQAIGHFQTNDVLYTIVVKKNNQEITRFNNIQVYCNVAITDCILNLNIQSSSNNPEGYLNYKDLNYLPVYTLSTKTYSLDFTTIDSSVKKVDLYAFSLVNNSNLICSDTITANNGQLLCAFNQNGTMLINAYVDGELLFTDYINVDYSKRVLGNVRYILMAFLLPFFVLFALSSGSLAVVMYFIGLIFGVGIYALDTQSYLGAGSFIIWFIIAGVVLLIKIMKGGAKNG